MTAQAKDWRDRFNERLSWIRPCNMDLNGWQRARDLEYNAIKALIQACRDDFTDSFKRQGFSDRYTHMALRAAERQAVNNAAYWLNDPERMHYLEQGIVRARERLKKEYPHLSFG